MCPQQLSGSKGGGRPLTLFLLHPVSSALNSQLRDTKFNLAFDSRPWTSVLADSLVPSLHRLLRPWVTPMALTTHICSAFSARSTVPSTLSA